MTVDEELETALAKSEAALADAVLHLASNGVDRIEADAKLERARAQCRQMRAALVKMRGSRYPDSAGFDHSGDSETKQSSVSSLPEGAANPLLAKESDTGNARAQPPLVRHAIDLLCLTLAYLQYFYIDVNLQIVSLPSVIG